MTSRLALDISLTFGTILFGALLVISIVTNDPAATYDAVLSGACGLLLWRRLSERGRVQ
ncbi:hypothetical protein [Nocardioides sp. GY 10127]|uniref:hypothetical protein n=1 Tax=Nocardioides sp. GY 10127 TaxID=2569762 RepID=UPI0014582981|nr:hypothetical protein [Nocardioides sp. GY 10127]